MRGLLEHAVECDPKDLKVVSGLNYVSLDLYIVISAARVLKCVAVHSVGYIHIPRMEECGKLGELGVQRDAYRTT